MEYDDILQQILHTNIMYDINMIQILKMLTADFLLVQKLYKKTVIN